MTDVYEPPSKDSTGSKESGSLINSVIDHVKGNWNTVTDSNADATSRIVAGTVLGIETAGIAAAAYGVSRFGAGKFLPAAEATPSLSTKLSSVAEGGLSTKLGSVPEVSASLMPKLQRLKEATEPAVFSALHDGTWATPLNKFLKHELPVTVALSAPPVKVIEQGARAMLKEALATHPNGNGIIAYFSEPGLKTGMIRDGRVIVTHGYM